MRDFVTICKMYIWKYSTLNQVSKRQKRNQVSTVIELHIFLYKNEKPILVKKKQEKLIK